MGKKNLVDHVVAEARTDTSGNSKRTTTMALIWGKGRVLADGSPAKGFYIHETEGPVVQAVPLMMYRDWAREGANDEAEFAKVHMRLFNVVLNDKIDFNAVQSGAHKYDLLINGEFSTETTATPIIKANARTLESSVPDGESLKRKKIDAASGSSPRDRINRINALKGDDTVKTETFRNAGGVGVEKSAMFPRPNDEWFGGMMFNPVSGKMGIWRDGDASSLVLKSGNQGQLEVAATDVQFDARIDNVSYGDLAENSVQTAGSFSSAVTPLPRFLPQVKTASWVSGLYSGLIEFFKSDDERRYGPTSSYAIYDHEVIDVDSFRPENSEES